MIKQLVEVNYSSQLMSLLQMFPNCSSVSHLNVFVFLFLRIPYQHHILSALLSHLTPSACAALLLSWRISITTKFSFLQSLISALNYMSDCLSFYPAQLFFVIFTQSLIISCHKGWGHNDGHVLTCCCPSFFFHRSHQHHHHHLFSSSL